MSEETTDTPGPGAPTKNADPQPTGPTEPPSDVTIAAMKGIKGTSNKSLAQVLEEQRRGKSKTKPAQPETEDPTMPKKTATKTGKATKNKTAPRAAKGGDEVTFAIRVSKSLQASIKRAADAAGVSKTEFATKVLEKAVAK